MPTFLLLTTLSPQGLQTLQATPERLIEFNREVESIGARVVQQWALLGPYDVLSVIEAPSYEDVAALSTDLSARGSAQMMTLTAITVDDFVAQFAEGSPHSSPTL